MKKKIIEVIWLIMAHYVINWVSLFVPSSISGYVNFASTAFLCIIIVFYGEESILMTEYSEWKITIPTLALFFMGLLMSDSDIFNNNQTAIIIMRYIAIIISFGISIPILLSSLIHIIKKKSL